ncbi:sensor histidine kinase [Ferribacterium limneticum]|uniref:sensor histidine kinase n=1 Tax=Ferribacterium limneticum TaxID=76259 RepID=UPI001CF7F792|nr:sensor histidine kinase [Ferribacterium limneticum]UCV24511.1 sensor histidine kinase [Ferribacterium limneticum]
MPVPDDFPLRPLDLKRHLFVRVSLFALAVLFVGTVVALVETRYRVRVEIQRTGQTIRQLLTDEIHQTSNNYNRSLEEIHLDLNTLQPIGALIHFCIQLTDLYSHPAGDRCFDRPIALPAPLEAAMRKVIGADAMYQGNIGQYPGITVGQITVTPNFGTELITLCWNLINLLAVSLTILLMSFVIYRPVRNALAPSEAMLKTLKLMENGNLQARMPTFALIELDRIGQGFNHLAERLQQTIGTQQRLARHLLTAREEERQYLSRELHDEFGQYLTSLNAEASFALELADEGVPALRPCAESISRTASHMMEVLQQILYRLRPVGLDEFGLTASLQQLIDQWNHRCRSTRFQLIVDNGLDHLPDNIAVTIYRIVQESLTNTVRHGQADNVRIRLEAEGDNLRLQVQDDGRGVAQPEVRSESRKSGGFGLLGMEERVLALGGTLQINALQPCGTLIDVCLPAHEPAEESA